MPVKKTSRTKAAKSRRPASKRSGGRGGPITRLTSKQVQQRLAEVARIGALFLEGEDVLNALMPEARAWTLADDINFDPAVAVPLKKTLLRIEKIETQFPVYAIVWRRRPDDAARVEIVLAGRMNSSFDQGKGKCPPMFPALKRVFDKGQPAAVAQSNESFEANSSFRYGHVWIVGNDSLLRASKRIISHFEPIRDSREQVVAALEITCVGTDS